jgi:hypothetical protein
VVLQQEGAPCHYALIVWLSWQTLPRSLDWSWRNTTMGSTFTGFNTINFFAWGFTGRWIGDLTNFKMVFTMQFRK